jgi:PPP family 3-phenylpropionic acid transporter
VFKISELPEAKRVAALFFSMNFIMYAAFAVFWPYMSAHYVNLGIDTGRIGILASITSIATIFVLPIWSRISDKTGNRRAVLKIVMLGSCLSVLLFILSKSFFTLFLTLSLFMCFHVCIVPLSDAVSISYLSQNQIRFSSIRIGGTFGFAVMMLFSGHVFEYNNNINFIIASVFYFVLFICARNIPQIEIEKKEKKKFEPRRLFKNKKVLFILFIAFIVQVAQGFYFVFIGVHIQSLGFTGREIGTANLIAVLFEIPIILVIDRILKRFSVVTVTIFCGFVVALRMFLLFAATDMILVYVSVIGNGISFIGMYYSCAIFINNEMESDLKSTGQSMLAFAQMGLGSIVGNLLGGFISMYAGTRFAFLYFGTGLAIVCTTCMIIFTTLKIKSKGTVLLLFLALPMIYHFS